MVQANSRSRSSRKVRMLPTRMCRWARAAAAVARNRAAVVWWSSMMACGSLMWCAAVAGAGGEAWGCGVNR